MKNVFGLLVLLLLSATGCSTDATDEKNTSDGSELESTMYFPPLSGTEWETISMEALNWNEGAVPALIAFLETTNTDAFIILQNGRIVMEEYFGNFDQNTPHSWNSAAKTLTSLTAGIAQQEGYLDIDQPSSTYMGAGWSSLTPEQESNITVRHHLTMTTGLDYGVPESACTDKDCFLYKNEPETFWYYHQGAYTVLDHIISGAVNQEFSSYFNAKIRNKIGMNGSWIQLNYLNLYFSPARSMARFGLLNLNKGVWDKTPILEDVNYFTEATTTSQNLNPAYGYLYWLNGKSTYKIPGSEALFQGKLIPNAPDDLIAGLGAFDQKMYIVPSKGLVIVRMGDSGNEDELGPTTYDNELWEYIKALIAVP